MKVFLTNALRWLALLPAAAAGAWVFYGFTLLTTSWTAFAPPGSLRFGAINIVSHFGMGMAFVLIGTMVAPSGRLAVAFLMTVLSLIIVSVSLLGSWLSGSYWFAVLALAAICGSLFAMVGLYKGRDELLPQDEPELADE